MALGGAPKTAGRKPSTRKRSNYKRPSTISVVDLLEDCNDQLERSLNQNDVPPMEISAAHPVNHMVCINQLLFNRIISSHEYKETVSFLDG